MTALRAYSVLENCESTGGIYFAEHDIVARRHGANEHADGDIGSVTCRRAPWADDYVGRPIPAKLMIAHGWHFECCGCGQRIDEDFLEERRLDIDGVVGTQWGRVYCGRRCLRADLSLERRRKAEQQRAIDMLKAFVSKRLPGVEFADDDPNNNWRSRAHATSAWRVRGWLWRSVAVSFRFPGMTVAPATCRLEDGNGRMGPYRPYFTCCPGDREAFEAFAKATKAVPA